MTYPPGTTSGGILRVPYTMVDGRQVVFMVGASDGDVNRFAANPAAAKLLDEDATIDFAALDNNNAFGEGIKPGARTRVTVKDGAATLGYVYSPLERDTGSVGDTLVYIDARFPVVMSVEDTDSSAATPLEFTTIGAPLVSLPPQGEFNYTGAAAYGRVGSSTHAAAGYTFTMTANFAEDAGQVTRFQFGSGLHGNLRLQAANLPTIDTATGVFQGAIDFTAGSGGATAIVPSNSTGTMYGQFHGDQAIGVTGGFHNNDNTVLGAFAGARNVAE